MISNTEDLLQEITAKVKKLKARNERLEKENEVLQKSVFDYLQKLDEHKNTINAKQKQLNNIHLGLSMKVNNEELLKEIDTYITLINKCIASVKSK
jgi:replicative DNA helicase